MNSKFRAALRSQAQTLSPVVMVGKEGISEGVINALNEALDIHELVKVRFENHKEKVKEFSFSLEQSTSSILVATTGFTSVFYRKNPEIMAYKALEQRCR